MYSCMKKEKWDLLKRFRNGGRGIKDNDGEWIQLWYIRTLVNGKMYPQ
jgi:hypothetical protein